MVVPRLIIQSFIACRDLYLNMASSMSTEQIFMSATQRIADGDVQLTDSQRMTFYGLQKQAIDGDCKVAAPPRGNISARSKYDAWIAYQGLSKENAMKKYIQALERVDPMFKPGAPIPAAVSSSSRETRSNSFVMNSTTVIKEGILYKQRDVFKGWRPRYFTLDDNFLNYYMQKGDIIPRKSMQIFGATITVVKPTKAGDVEYFPFVISHPKTTKVYNLSATSKAEVDTWIAALTEAASKEAPPNVPLSVVDRLIARRPIPDDEESTTIADREPVNKPLTTQNIPEKYAHKIDLAVNTMLDLTSSEGWIPMFEQHGVKASRKSGTGAICVKGEIMLPYTIAEIYAVITNEAKKKELDVQIHSSQKIKHFSSHTGIEHVKFKQVWPTPVRDFCNLTHWRLLNNGDFVYLYFSEKFETICPIEDGVVRAELILGGYVLRPVSGGTQCYFISQCDLRGTMPSSVFNLLAAGQPMVLANLKIILDEIAKTQPRAGIFKKKAVTYEEMLFVAENSKVDRSATAAVFEISKEINESTSKKDATESDAATSDKIRHTVKTAVKSAIQEAIDPSARRKRLRTLDTVALSVLFFPVALYYAVNSELRGIAFIVGFFFAVEYVMRVHLGIPHRKVSTMELGTIPNGRMLVRFNVDLTKFLRYLETSRAEYATEITVTHVAAKAVAVALSEIPNLNGHVIGGDFYQSRSSGVDVSVSLELFENETVVIKLDNADAKPIDYIATEMQTRTQELRDGTNVSYSRKARLLGLLPPFLSGYLRHFINTLGGKYGISLPLLGVVGFPHGAATIVTLPSKEASDHEIDIAMISSMTDSSTPIVVTIGGVRLAPILDQDRKLSSMHVLNVAISIDNNAGSLAEGKRFAARLQQLMNSPSLLDKADRRAAISKEDEKIAEEKASARASMLKKK